MVEAACKPKSALAYLFCFNYCRNRARPITNTNRTASAFSLRRDIYKELLPSSMVSLTTKSTNEDTSGALDDPEVEVYVN
jgi:hypothetical protein